MSGFLTLEDGRTLCGSSIGMAGMYFLISDMLPEGNAEMKAWLKDVSERPAPFLDFDLRELPTGDIEAFYKASVQALDMVIHRFGEDVFLKENAFSANCLRRLLEMHNSISSGEEPNQMNDLDEVQESTGLKIDYKEIWFD